MSSSVSRRIYRAAEAEDDVYVVGEGVRRFVPADETVTTVSSLLDGARRRAGQIVAEAEARAAGLIAQAEAECDRIREEAFEAGRAAGSSAGEGAITAQLDVIRAAAADGLALRNAMIEDAMPTIARAVALACRRVVGAAFEADPSLTAEACAEAVRSAAGQQILAIRVNPGVAEDVRASLVDVADYVRPDDGIEIGGCIIDVQNGTIDATLDARLSLMELGLRAAGGGAA
jgi:flagellar biosynthesis/type III secretory pathway protein FliH